MGFGRLWTGLGGKNVKKEKGKDGLVREVILKVDRTRLDEALIEPNRELIRTGKETVSK